MSRLTEVAAMMRRQGGTRIQIVEPCSARCHVADAATAFEVCHLIYDMGLAASQNPIGGGLVVVTANVWSDELPWVNYGEGE